MRFRTPYTLYTLALSVAILCAAAPGLDSVRLVAELSAKGESSIDHALETLEQASMTEWVSDQRVIAALAAVANDHRLPQGSRLRAASLLFSSDHPAEARHTLQELASAPDQAIASSAAYTLVFAAPFTLLPESKLEELLLSSAGALYEAAAMAIAWQCDPSASLAIQARVIPVLEKTSTDRRRDPSDRGASLEALGCYADSPEVLEFLVSQLEPSAWFFGAPGHHGPRHSAASVLHAINQSKASDLAARIAFFKELLPQIPESQYPGDIRYELRRIFPDLR